jgi:hypothetical protein
MPVLDATRLLRLFALCFCEIAFFSELSASAPAFAVAFVVAFVIRSIRLFFACIPNLRKKLFAVLVIILVCMPVFARVIDRVWACMLLPFKV